MFRHHKMSYWTTSGNNIEIAQTVSIFSLSEEQREELQKQEWERAGKNWSAYKNDRDVTTRCRELKDELVKKHGFDLSVKADYDKCRRLVNQKFGGMVINSVMRWRPK